MDAYRKPSKRKKLPRTLRSWFIQNADASEKGPFELDALLSSGRASRLKPSTLIRPEGETEWQTLSIVMAAEAAGAQRPGASSTEDDEPEPGNFVSGLCAGLFGGIFGFALVSFFAKGTETKRGARWGFILQIALGLAVRVFLATLPSSRY